MADFSTESEMGVVLDQTSLRAARQEIEDELGDLTVGVTASTSAGPTGMASATPDGGRRLGVSGRGSPEVQLLAEQLEVLEEINEDLEKAEGGGGGGGLGRGVLGGAATLGLGLQGTLLGMGAFGAKQTAKFASGDLPVEEMPLYQGMSQTGDAVSGAVGDAVGSVGINIDEDVAALQQELRNLTPPDIDLGLHKDAQAFEQRLSNLDAPQLDPGLVDHFTMFDQRLNNLQPPELDVGLDDALTNFEQGLNQIQPPDVLDDISAGADEALDQAIGEIDSSIPVDLDTAVDLNTQDLRRDLERAVRDGLRDFDLRREVIDIVEDEFGL